MVLKRVLVVDDERNIRTSLKGSLEDEGFVVQTANDGAEALKAVGTFRPDVILLDIWMPGDDGLTVLDQIKKQDSSAIVIIMSGHGTVETAVRAIKLGAFDFLEKPLNFDKVLVLLKHAFDLKDLASENRQLKEQLRDREELIGESPPMEHLRHVVGLAAPSNGWVLIQGENGTGKELVARALHEGSTRSENRFVAVNCAAVPEELIESELFGHEKGAFTGAQERKIGKFELAHQGTLFLDEVGDMGPKMQAKILRVLQECCFHRVGGSENIEVDVRVIAATNKDLLKGIQTGEFREDLFYRLNVIPLRVPPLRERVEDIPRLVGHFLKRFGGSKKKSISAATFELLRSYQWPGNVRELKNWVERACILEAGDVIDTFEPGVAEMVSGATSLPGASDETSLRAARAEFERKFILKMLAENDGNISKTAQKIGVERSHLHKKMRNYGIRELNS